MKVHGAAVDAWRSHFPALAYGKSGQSFTYLDNAATVHRPAPVVDAMTDFYRRHNGNPGAGLHALAEDANTLYEAARARIAAFLGALDPLEVVFTRGTTEAINLVATAWGGTNLRSGDEVIVTVAEHYSNLVPWQIATRRAGATLRFLDVDDTGDLRLDQLDRLLSPRTKLISVSQVSNVLGVLNPVREIAARAHAVGAAVLIDAAQSAPHMPVNVRELGCDFLALSAHKLTGPMGSGALWARRELLEAMSPYQAGGDMAHGVTRDRAQYAAGALKFEAGTPNVADAIGFAAATDFLEHEVRWSQFRVHEAAIAAHLLEQLARRPGIRILGPIDPGRASERGDKLGLVAFTVQGWPALDVVHALDRAGVGVRGGELAALPLLARFGVDAAVRASAYLYTTRDDIDHLVDALDRMQPVPA